MKTGTTGKFVRRIAVTIGDPFGIGPEVTAKSIEHWSPGAAVVILCSPEYINIPGLPVVHSVDDACEQGIFVYHLEDVPPESEPSFQYVKTAVDWALAGKAHAVVTAPISKEKWFKAGINYNGHTDFLVKASGVKRHSMFFWSQDLKVALFTIHIPLKDIFPHIQKDRIVDFIRFVDSELERLFNKKFTILVNGLNPHAGENGFLGTEERDIIIPAMEELKDVHRLDLQGPFPPDIIFIKAREIEDSVVISWYHDQGLIGFKLLNIHEGVNMTLGLPFIRTSPDHGTGFDIAGKNIANPSSMKQALLLAEQLVTV